MAGFSMRSEQFKFTDLLGQLQASTSAPSESQQRSADQLGSKLAPKVEKLNQLAGKDFPEFLKQIGSKGLRISAYDKIVIP